ncbi:hypothetical protein SAMN04488542_15411 [Fontibacillus panacisegetis]|uniref:PKD domain-containing protein n=1 Tax=Fontibacillus panacisegetis TaxID=670482 RepID=A0A1G7V0S3_9BACL|nr:hypothetical protein [Fontibacillus panacisegetis]SDG52959.1 hypothetical protein SAMN04488542_15411 [Fontibacillus panacisegetis]
MTSLIGRIVLEPSTVRPGETVRVEVCGNDNNLLNDSTTEVTINGVRGSLQYLQFPSIGQRKLTVNARTPNGEIERQEVLLNVEGSPLTFPSLRKRSDIAMLGITQLPMQPYTAVLTLGSIIDTRTPHQAQTGPSISPKMIQGLGKGTLVPSIATRGILGRAISANQKALVRTESRRLVNLQAKGLNRTANGVRIAPDTIKRRLIGEVYDLSKIDIKKILEEAQTDPIEFEWDFGDGNTATTRTPVVSHDYFAAIDHATGIGQFVVTCHVKHASLTIKRTLTIHSAYAICKGTGTIVPHVTADFYAQKRYNMLTGFFTVYNVENAPMILDRVSITPLATDGEEAALPKAFTHLDRPITIAAKSSSRISVNVPFVTNTPQAGQLRYDVKSFLVLYAGTVERFPVRCSAVFDVPAQEWNQKPRPLTLPNVPKLERKPWPWEIVEGALSKITDRPSNPSQPGHTVLDPQTGTLAVSLGPLGTNIKSLTQGKIDQAFSSVYAPITKSLEVHRLAAPTVKKLPNQIDTTKVIKNNVTIDALKKLTKKLGEGIHTISAPPSPGPIAEGQICDPDNLTEEELKAADAGQLVCQRTDEVQEVLMPARWMNARKGDCILSPGGDGIIGGLMLNVNPAQWYSHSGIMTRNYDEITHSTGSQQRLMDHLVGVVSDGSDGFEPKVLKYIWPGAVTQTVQHSIEGEKFPDPEYDKTYSISSFGAHSVGVTHNDQFKMIPPLVVKPDPLQETPAVRTALHAIATDARNNAGRPGVKPKYHYRWYCYTDPTIGLRDPEGPEAGWAEGTRPSVCSSYIWMHAKAHQAHLESSQPLVTPTDLEPSDISQGANIRPTTPDGLYNYSAKEREKAAYWLYDNIYNMAYDKAGWFGEILTDGSDDIANQFLNAFAHDVADGKDSEDWKNVTDADAVSPDDMLWWDGPAQGGVYGYAEPAIYREPRVESYTVSRWKKVLNRGTIRGKVLYESGPVAGAFVQAYDGKTTYTDKNGVYTLQDVPLGKYLLKSSKVIDGILYTAEANINLNIADLVVDIHLQPPADRYRIAQIFLDFWGRDEETIGSDEILNPGPEYLELELGPDKLANSAHRKYKWGGEMRVEYAITVRLLLNNTIDVQVQGTLYEGTSEDNNDLDGQGGLTFQVGVGNTTGATLTITNTDEEDDDAGILTISVKNVRNNN